MNSGTDLGFSTYGVGHVHGEQSLLFNVVDENKPLTLYTSSSNSADDEECHAVSSDDLMEFSSKDLMILQGVIGENLVSEIPIAPEVKDDIKETDVIAKQERKVVLQTEQSILSRHEPTQLPLSRDSSSRRAFTNNPSRVNGELTSITQIIYKSSGVAPSTSRSQSLRGQQDDLQIKKIKRAVSTCTSNAGSFRVEESPGTPGGSSVLENKTSRPRKPARVKHTPFNSYAAPDIVKSSPNLVHREGTFFYVTTSCGACSYKIEHKLLRPGHWPPSHCSKCGSKWTISDWKNFATDTDDDIVYLGEFVSAVPCQRNINVNPAYNPSCVKVEPVDERFTVPPCRHCGGYHNAMKGRPYDPDFCPMYGVPSNHNYGRWN